jgi:polyisoprenoid-binding protein YceI
MHMRRSATGPILLLLAALAASAPAASAQAPSRGGGTSGASTWRIDAGHSELSFRIRHLVSRVRGNFDQWTGTVVADPRNLAAGTVEVTIDPATIDTGNANRDRDLRGSDFFDVARFPTITFRSRRVEATGSRLRVTGDLTMRGVTKPVVLEGEFTGVAPDAQKRRRMGFELSTTIDRKDFGVTWNEVVDGAGLLLGDEVEISILAEAVEADG